MSENQKKKVFIVDDEEGILQLYKEELTEDGYDVFAVDNGENLLEKIKEFAPDVIILDIKIGGYNGLDLLQDVRDGGEVRGEDRQRRSRGGLPGRPPHGNRPCPRPGNSRVVLDRGRTQRRQRHPAHSDSERENLLIVFKRMYPFSLFR